MSFSYSLMESWQRLKQKPTYVASASAIMGATLGALLCVVTLAYVMLVKPLPYPNQERLFQAELLQYDQSNTMNVNGFSYAGLIDFYNNQHVFNNAALIDYGTSALISHADQPAIKTSFITPSWFSIFGASLQRGRFFEPEGDIHQSKAEVVISHHAWMRLYNGDENIIGKKITTRDLWFTIVGVMDKEFIEPPLLEKGYQSDFWFPWQFNTTPQSRRDLWWGRAHQRTFIGELLPNISVANAEKMTSDYVNEKWQAHNGESGYYQGWHVALKLTPLKTKIIGNSETAAYLLMVSCLFLFIIATLNIINLYLSHIAANQYQFAVQSVVGARKKHLYWSLFLENLLLMIVVVLIAFGIAQIGFDIMQWYLTTALPRVDELSLQPVTCLFAGIAVLSIALIFTVIGVRAINLKRLNTHLNSSGKGTAVQVSAKLRRWIITSQVAMSILLVFSASTIGMKAFNAITYDDGLEVNTLHSLQLRMYSQNLPSTAGMNNLVEQLRVKLSSLPQVSLVSRSRSPLLSATGSWSLVDIANGQQVIPQGRIIDHQYFSLTKQQLLSGRVFTHADVQSRANELVINETLAKILDPNAKVLGKRLSFDISAPADKAFTIVGVVSDHLIPGSEHVVPSVYRPLADRFSLMIQLAQGQQLPKGQLNKVMAEVSDIFRIFHYQPMSVQKYERLFTQYVTAVVAFVVVLLSLCIAGVGLYGVLNYQSLLRKNEFGTRLAIGARRADILLLVIKEHTRAFCYGLGVSVIGLLILHYFLGKSVAYFLPQHVLWYFSATLLMVYLIMLVACYMPIRRYIYHPVLCSLRGDK